MEPPLNPGWKVRIITSGCRRGGRSGAAKLGGRFVPHRPVAELDDGHAGLIAAAPEGRGAEAHGLHHPWPSSGRMAASTCCMLRFIRSMLVPPPFHEHIEHAPVLGRGEARRQLAKEGANAAKAKQQHQGHPDGAAQHGPSSAAITLLHPAKSLVQVAVRALGLSTARISQEPMAGVRVSATREEKSTARRAGWRTR